ncbi:MFS transporter [Micromonospora polyrhachis]
MAWGTVRVLRDRNSGLYLGGVLVSGFGTAAMLLAAGVWVKSLTGSSSLAALVTFCVWAPTLVGPAIGVLADRVRRRPLLIATNATLAAMLLVLLSVDSADRVWILFAIMVVYGVGMVLADAAEAAIVTTIVPGNLLGDFNGLRMTVNEGMKLVAPLAGAGLLAQFGSTPVVLLNTGTFVLAALTFSLLRMPEKRPERQVGNWTRQIIEGVRFVRHQPVVRHLVFCAAVTMLLAGLNGAVIYAVVDDGLHRSPAFVGVLYAVQGVGSTISGLATGPLLRRIPERIFAAAGILLFALGIGLRAIPSTSVALATSFAIGLGLPCVLIATLTAVQRETPGQLIGRVSATANTLIFAPNTVALAIGAGLIAVIDYRPLLVAMGVAGLLVAGYCLRRGGGPASPSEPPAGAPEDVSAAAPVPQAAPQVA